MDTLADVAQTLGKAADAQHWRSRADELLNRLIAHSWNGEQFVSVLNRSHEVCGGDCLINYLPILLGQRLPVEIQRKLITGLARFITEYGVATENPASPRYEPDSYWRGPIWAPPTIMIAFGLDALGERALAVEITRKFCEMVRRSGMSENFDPFSGEGLRDRAYTWTSSIFLILAHEFLMT